VVAARPLARPAIGLVTALLLSQALLGADCVDGTTPDCSDAASRCGPDLDGADAADASVVVPDSASADAAVADAADGD
jgi:hypothetical protein